MPRFNTVSPLGEEKLALDARRVGQGDARLSLSQEQLLLNKAQMIENAAATRFKIETARREAISSAMAISALGDADPTKPTYPKIRATILSRFPDSLNNKAVIEVLGKTDQMHISFQGAQQTLELEKQKDDARQALETQKTSASAPFDTATAADKYATAIQHLDDIVHANKYGQVDSKTGTTKPIPVELQNAKTFMTQQLATLTAPTGAAVPAPVSPPAAPVAAPTATVSPTPGAVAVQDASSFLAKALGQAPAAPQPQPVQAATSGLPDTSESALTSATKNE